MTVDEVAQWFSLPDLQPALTDYLACVNAYCRPVVHSVGGQHYASPTAVLPFNELQIWLKVQIQNMLFHGIQDMSTTQTLFTSLPDTEWAFRHYDATILNIDGNANWPWSGLCGK